MRAVLAGWASDCRLKYHGWACRRRDRCERSSLRDRCERSSLADFMVNISRCSELPDLTGEAAACIQYKGYKRAHDGDPPCELTARNVKWVKRHHTDHVTWALKVEYTNADGEVKQVHKTPCYFEDRSTSTHARVHPHVRGQCSRMCTAPAHLTAHSQFARSEPEDPDKYYDGIQMLQAELQAIYDRDHHHDVDRGRVSDVHATDSLGSSTWSEQSSLPSAAGGDAAPGAPSLPSAAGGEAAPETAPDETPPPPPPPPRPPPVARRQVSLADSFMRSSR